ncbi:hypothetical protein AB2G88_24125 (plasmid) [Escherichia coli]
MQLNSLINGALDSNDEAIPGGEEERKLQQERLIEAEKQRDLERKEKECASVRIPHQHHHEVHVIMV